MTNTKYQKLAVVIHVPWTKQNLVISCCYFAQDGKEMNGDSKCSCTAIVLLVKPLAWRLSRWRRRSGLLKLSNLFHERAFGMR